jgi:hypothetical protein
VRKALGTLQFVEQDTIKADVRTKRVVFTVSSHGQFNEEQVKKALEGVGFGEAKVLEGPGSTPR